MGFSNFDSRKQVSWRCSRQVWDFMRMAQGVASQKDLQNPRILTLHLALHHRTEKWTPGAYGFYSQKRDFKYPVQRLPHWTSAWLCTVVQTATPPHPKKKIWHLAISGSLQLCWSEPRNHIWSSSLAFTYQGSGSLALARACRSPGLASTFLPPKWSWSLALLLLQRSCSNVSWLFQDWTVSQNPAPALMTCLMRQEPDSGISPQYCIHKEVSSFVWSAPPPGTLSHDSWGEGFASDPRASLSHVEAFFSCPSLPNNTATCSGWWPSAAVIPSFGHWNWFSSLWHVKI